MCPGSLNRIPTSSGDTCLVTLKTIAHGGSGTSGPHPNTASDLERVVGGPVVVRHEELVVPLHELEVVLEPSLDESVHWQGLVHVELGEGSLQQLEVLNVLVLQLSVELHPLDCHRA